MFVTAFIVLYTAQCFERIALGDKSHNWIFYAVLPYDVEEELVIHKKITIIIEMNDTYYISNQ